METAERQDVSHLPECWKSITILLFFSLTSSRFVMMTEIIKWPWKKLETLSKQKYQLVLHTTKTRAAIISHISTIKTGTLQYGNNFLIFAHSISRYPRMSSTLCLVCRRLFQIINFELEKLQLPLTTRGWREKMLFTFHKRFNFHVKIIFAIFIIPWVCAASYYLVWFDSYFERNIDFFQRDLLAKVLPSGGHFEFFKLATYFFAVFVPAYIFWFEFSSKEVRKLL